MHLQTINCIICGRKAKLYGGHMLDNNKHVIAGFCSEKCYESEESDENGCYGKYDEHMGKEVITW